MRETDRLAKEVRSSAQPIIFPCLGQWEDMAVKHSTRSKMSFLMGNDFGFILDLDPDSAPPPRRWAEPLGHNTH
jgi:hypothetical protein